MIFIYGALAKEYPKENNIKVHSAAEAIKAMEANFKGFRNAIKRNTNYWVVRGSSLKEGKSVVAEETTMKFKDDTWHICPIPLGYGGKAVGIGVIIAGVILIAASFWTGGTTAAPGFKLLGVGAGLGGFVGTLGVAMVFGGVAQLLAPTPPEYDYSGGRDDPDQRASYLFNGPVNISSPGDTIPVAYGTTYIGSIFISGGLKVDNI